jgi:hypothetical protein
MSGYPPVYNPVVANPNDGELITLCKILDSIAALSPAVVNADQPYTRVSTASTNATLIKASAGKIYNFVATNTVNGTRYVKFYDKATTPDPTTDSPDYIIPLNKDQTTSLALGVSPFYFHNGISFAIVTSATGDGAVGAGDVVLSFTWG